MPVLNFEEIEKAVLGQIFGNEEIAWVVAYKGAHGGIYYEAFATTQEEAEQECGRRQQESSEQLFVMDIHRGNIGIEVYEPAPVSDRLSPPPEV